MSDMTREKRVILSTRLRKKIKHPRENSKLGKSSLKNRKGKNKFSKEHEEQEKCSKEHASRSKFSKEHEMLEKMQQKLIYG